MADFIVAAELAELTGIRLKTLYNQNSSGTGPLAGILCKLGNKKLGAWRSDYEQWRDAQLKLKPAPATEQHAAA